MKTNSRKSKKSSKKLLQPALLDLNKLKRLYATMLRCRMLVQKLNELEEHGRVQRGTAPETGSEAIAAGILLDLRPDDRLAPGAGSITARLARGEPVKSILAETFGSWRSRRTLSIIPGSMSAAAQLNIVLGAAWAGKTHGEDRVSVSFCREEPLHTSEWHAAVTFSVLNKLPLIHVIQTCAEAKATLGGHSPLSSHERKLDTAQLPTLIIDGDDAIAAYRVGQEAIRRARQGRGPALILCQTASPDTMSLPHRDTPLPSDPIAKMEDYLQRKGCWSEKWKTQLAANFARELDRAIDLAEKSRLQLLSSERIQDSALASAG